VPLVRGSLLGRMDARSIASFRQDESSNKLQPRSFHDAVPDSDLIMPQKDLGSRHSY